MGLIRCALCSRHHRADEPACPFCRPRAAGHGAPLDRATGPLAAGLAALVLSGCPDAPRPQPPAPVYGGPPPPAPVDSATPTPTEPPPATDVPPDAVPAPAYGAPPPDAPVYGAPPPGR